MKKYLQIFHFILLGVAVLSIILLQNLSGKEDAGRSYVDITLVVLISIWPFIGFLAIMLGKRESNQDRLSIVVSWYKTLLTRSYFLVLANALLVVVCSFVMYYLFFYRTLTIRSNEVAATTISLHDSKMQKELFFGVVTRDTPLKRRLKINTHYDFVMKKTGEDIGSFHEIIEFSWNIFATKDTTL